MNNRIGSSFSTLRLFTLHFIWHFRFIINCGLPILWYPLPGQSWLPPMCIVHKFINRNITGIDEDVCVWMCKRAKQKLRLWTISSDEWTTVMTWLKSESWLKSDLKSSLKSSHDISGKFGHFLCVCRPSNNSTLLMWYWKMDNHTIYTIEMTIDSDYIYLIL